jgi:hypothetical protein
VLNEINEERGWVTILDGDAGFNLWTQNSWATLAKGKWVTNSNLLRPMDKASFVTYTSSVSSTSVVSMSLIPKSVCVLAIMVQRPTF